MFASNYSHPLVLFSSSSSKPLQLFQNETDAELPSDSFIHFLRDCDSTPPANEAAMITLPALNETGNPGHSLAQTVLHMQSPTIQKTFICCPPEWTQEPLGIRLPWFHLQVRNLGREFSFEIGVCDTSKREGIIRCSTFQRKPQLSISSRVGIPPLLHLPLAFPSKSSHSLTAWSTVDLHLPTLMSNFSSMKLLSTRQLEDDSQPHSVMMNPTVPGASYLHATYVKIYATCRLRKIWFSKGGPDQKLSWEFSLYGATD